MTSQTENSSLPDTPAKLLRFLIFNSSWGPREGEEEKKIIYYWPPEEEAEEKTKHVGLVEALVRFMSVFSQTPAKIQHTQKSKSVFAEFEEGFWIVMTVAAPSKQKKAGDNTSEPSHSVESLHDNVLEAKLKKTYDLFKIFTGGFLHLAHPEAIKAKAEGFFNRYIPTLTFQPSQNVNDLFGAVQFLTLEPMDFLHVKSFVNKIEGEFGCIDKCLFLHHGNIVWSGIQQKETQLLYFYVYHTLLPAAQNIKANISSPGSPFGGHQGRFLTGPAQLDGLTSDEVNSLRIPKVFVPHVCEETQEESLQEYHFIVYHAIKSTLCLLIPCEVSFTVDFFRRLDSHVGPRLSNMSADLLDVFGRSGIGSNFPSTSEETTVLSPSICMPPVVIDPKEETEMQLVYFNDANKAMKNTLNPQMESVQYGISDLRQDFSDLKKFDDSNQKVTTELILKMPNEDWIVGKQVDQRQVYLALKNKSSLLDVNDSVEKIMSTEFKNICLPP